MQYFFILGMSPVYDSIITISVSTKTVLYKKSYQKKDNYKQGITVHVKISPS